MFVAKMVTKYPDFKGEGYYNFLMEEDRGELEGKIQENLHDFKLVAVEELPYDDMDEMLEVYPTKEELNKVFENA